MECVNVRRQRACANPKSRRRITAMPDRRLFPLCGGWSIICGVVTERRPRNVDEYGGEACAQTDVFNGVLPRAGKTHDPKVATKTRHVEQVSRGDGSRETVAE